MTEEKENVEDFVSLWRKKIKDDPNKPSAIGETLVRLNEIEKENEELREVIKGNIDLITYTEEIVKKTIEENERLKSQLRDASTLKKDKIYAIQQVNQELNNKMKRFLQNIKEKEVEIQAKASQIIDLNLKLEDALKQIASFKESTPKTDTKTNELINDLQSELTQKKSRIVELEQNISRLSVNISSLNEKLIKKEKSSPVDYVNPVETPKTQVIKPQPTQTSPNTLEILCQDLQADLNKYKKIVDKLNKEKSDLQNIIDTKGVKFEPEEIDELKKENEEIKIELSQLQENLREKPKATPNLLSLIEAERLIEGLKEELKLKDQLIQETKASKPPESISPQPISPQQPMSNLIEDLQKQINKLKMMIEEKNKIIEKLKSS
ncbi:hypothetical protein LCGC14_1243790 [marine sediment metagenome]|uniref:Uncharacterized protein n=1 Tax=marine sediment metagenome TaxID=412755 RepID=A0A0F9P957_9ZZZZ|nr:MAG: hypothetical protein Lokiarch_33260 [Candidatus Lokiarchaeum sp. GC14_75]HEC39650.1 hypothetical protein [bacterium]